MRVNMLKILILFVLFGIQNGELKRNPELDTFLKIKSYEDDLNTSLLLDKVDKRLLKSWAEKYQVKQVNLTVEFRIQMMTHRDHNFRTNVSEKWEDCIHTYKRRINRMDFNFDEEERECLRPALTAGDEQTQAVAQIEKEKRKWRNGYKYLVNLCKSNYFTEIEIATCTVDYVEKDAYNQTLRRLIMLKLKAMGDLLLKLHEALFALEECLRINLSEYLTNVRSVMKILDRCYNGRKN